MAYCAIYNIHFQRVHVNYARERNAVTGKKSFIFCPFGQLMPSLARRRESFTSDPHAKNSGVEKSLAMLSRNFHTKCSQERIHLL